MKIINFITWWLVAFSLSYAVFSFLPFVPAEVGEFNANAKDYLFQKAALIFSGSGKTLNQTVRLSESKTGSSTPVITESVLPTRIIIDKIGVDDPVKNPETRDVSALDSALTEGVVRYPGSGGLSDNANMLLFGHSTNWQTVHNQAYKSFNRLEELNLGDLIKVRSADTEYLYRVTSVALLDKDKALVEFSTGEKMITLSTCDTFGAKSDRFVVEAKFLRSYPFFDQS